MATAAALAIAVPVVWTIATRAPGRAEPAPLAFVSSPKESPTPPSRPAHLPVIRGSAAVAQRPGEPVTLCVKAEDEAGSHPCSSIKVVGVDVTALPVTYTNDDGSKGGFALFTGGWHHASKTLFVDEIAQGVTRDAPTPSFTSLCDNPTGTRHGDRDAPGAEPPHDLYSLPGFQYSWEAPRDDGSTVLQVGVIGDKAEVEARIRQTYTGLLCVGTLPGPTHRGLEEAMGRVDAVGLAPEANIQDMSIALQPEGFVGVRLRVFVATDDAVAAIKEALGPEVEPWAVIDGDFVVVG